MISYPGQILRRFGRYEAVEDLGARERGRYWRAWDPFLERFVRVAELSAVDAAEIQQTLPRLDYALKLWLGGGNAEAVLDFSPGGSQGPAFLVLRFDGADGAPTRRDLPSPARSPSRTAQTPVRQSWVSRLLGGVGIVRDRKPR